MALSWTVSAGSASDRLDRVVAALWGESRGAARRAVEAGGVYVDGSRCRTASRAIGGGVRIEVEPRAEQAAARGRAILEAQPPRLIHRDRHVVLVDKPPGLPVSATRQTVHGTVEAWLGEEGFGYVALHHRLDREAEGLLAVAVHKAANRGLARAFQERQARRTYRALLGGRLEGEGTWRHDVVQRRGRRVAVEPGRGGKSMVARWRALEPRGPDTLVEVELETGRTHQIRLQSAAVGHPVLGDRLYGGGERGGLRLQAARLELPHPVTGAVLVGSLPEPPSWRGQDQGPEDVAPEPGDERGAAEKGPEGELGLPVPAVHGDVGDADDAAEQ